MKYLITGSGGLVGSEAVDYFRAQGHEVIGIDNNMRSRFFGIEQPEPELNLDIRNNVAIDELFEHHTFDVIIHTAAQPSHDWSKEFPLIDFHVNASGTLHLLEATRKHCPDAIFVHVSTDKIYGQGMKCLIAEDDTRYKGALFNEFTEIETALSPFGVSKLAADFYVQEYGAQWGIKTVCFRCGCITGRRHKGAEQHGFLAYLAKCIKEGITYKIFGYKGKQVRDLIHSYDLVTAFDAFIQNPKISAVYNMGGGVERSVSILEAIELIEKETGKKAVTEYVKEERFADRIWDVHDVTKFRKDYPDWNYKYSLDEIIKDVCKT